MSLYEASDFWDEHDFEEVDDIKEVRDIKFSLKKKKYVGVDIKLYSLIKNKARRLHKPEVVLISEWLSEKVKI